MPLVNHITYGLSSLRTPVALTPYADTRATSVSYLAYLIPDLQATTWRGRRVRPRCLSAAKYAS